MKNSISLFTLGFIFTVFFSCATPTMRPAGEIEPQYFEEGVPEQLVSKLEGFEENVTRRDDLFSVTPFVPLMVQILGHKDFQSRGGKMVDDFIRSLQSFRQMYLEQRACFAINSRSESGEKAGWMAFLEAEQDGQVRLVKLYSEIVEAKNRGFGVGAFQETKGVACVLGQFNLKKGFNVYLVAAPDRSSWESHLIRKLSWQESGGSELEGISDWMDSLRKVEDAESNKKRPGPFFSKDRMDGIATAIRVDDIKTAKALIQGDPKKFYPSDFAALSMLFALGAVRGKKCDVHFMTDLLLLGARINSQLHKMVQFKDVDECSIYALEHFQSVPERRSKGLTEIHRQVTLRLKDLSSLITNEAKLDEFSNWMSVEARAMEVTSKQCQTLSDTTCIEIGKMKEVWRENFKVISSMNNEKNLKKAEHRKRFSKVLSLVGQLAGAGSQQGQKQGSPKVKAAADPKSI
ncbi:MAG: hypothetical protein JNL01_06455 [Bdellovibrionales bacterium]|nr:hypothetical protein [Bdellovibrionales bacterium]